MDRAVAALVLATGIAVLGGRGVAAQQIDVDDVTVANEAFYDAFSARDMAQMDAVWAHEAYVRVIYPTSTEIDAGWDAVRAHWQDAFDLFSEIGISMPEPDVRAGDQVAWVVGLEQVQARLASGEDVSFTTMATNVFERSGDKWLMVHHHASAPTRP